MKFKLLKLINRSKYKGGEFTSINNKIWIINMKLAYQHIFNQQFDSGYSQICDSIWYGLGGMAKHDLYYPLRIKIEYEK